MLKINFFVMSQDSHDLSGFDEKVIVLSSDSHTGLSEKVADMGIDTEEDNSQSVLSEKSAVSSNSVCIVKVKKEDTSGQEFEDSSSSIGRKPRRAAVSAMKNISGNKRRISSSSECSSASSYSPRRKDKPSGGATKKKKVENSSTGSNTRTVHVVQTAKNGRVIIEGLCVTKKTGQVFYPQDSIFVFRENDDDINNIKSLIDENKQKWIDHGHSASVFSCKFNGSLPTVIGGFTRGFAKSIFK